MKKLPKTIYIVREEDAGDSYLIATKDTDTIDHGQQVGVYELREVMTKQVTHTLVDANGF
jgi:hypothetical protein